MDEINKESFYSAEQKEEKLDNSINTEQSSNQSSAEIEILGEQFRNYFLIAQALLKTLRRSADIEICASLLRKVQSFNDSKQTEIRRNNNYFFRYYLRVLKWTSDNQPVELYGCWHRNQEYAVDMMESRVWLEQNKCFMAFKRLKDGSIVIYSAMSDESSSGWQDRGLNILAKR